VRALIKVGTRCNNSCAFCHAAGRAPLDDTTERIVEKIDRARALGAKTLVLSGGEPTVRADLLALAERVAAAGMRFGLVTHARRLSNAAFAGALLERGLAYVVVSLHGADAATHDALVGVPGAFAETVAALGNLHGRVPELFVNAVVTRANLRGLRGLVDLARAYPSVVLKLTMPQPKGAALADFDRVVPDLSEACAAVADAIRYGGGADPLAEPARFGHEGFPLCLLPGLKRLRDDLRTHGFACMSEVDDADFHPVDDLLLFKPPACEGCAQRDACPGIYRGYAQRRALPPLRPYERQPTQAGTVPVEVTAAWTAGSDRDAAQRERAAFEQRQWVRLTWACNNRCAFCLDREVQRPEPRDDAAIRREILEGRRRGATRLVLSGGEPTTHPRLLAFIRFGKLAGYRWVQVVTNGRMFSYRDLFERAVAAGLDEITFSMHGHTAELHDRLVGAPGAFEQASRALRRALASGRVVANVDVVINAHNVEHLPEMLETFVAWGVREIDLLHLIPFGGAWESDAGLFYDPRGHMPALGRALALSRREGVRLWLNRFPPEHAEGFEHLIQDPHKLHDEVRGREGELAAYLAGGPPLPCRQPGRCRLCYLGRLCDALERARDAIARGRVSALLVTAPLRSGASFPAADVVEVVATGVNAAAEAAATLRAPAVRLRLRDLTGLGDALGADGRFAARRLDAVVVADAPSLGIALSAPGTFEVVVEASRATFEPLGSELARAHAPRLVVRQPTYERLSEQIEADVDLAELFARLAPGVRAEGVAPCLSGRAAREEPEMLDAWVLDEAGRIDAQRFTAWFVRRLFLVKSLRCEACALAGACHGMHLNWVRAHGFGAMRPIGR
jgi:MoaA/NifB/PqqE/SkfB family radical SAM enzyme